MMLTAFFYSRWWRVLLSGFIGLWLPSLVLADEDTCGFGAMDPSLQSTQLILAMKSVEQAKDELRMSIWTMKYECPSGACRVTNASEACNTLAVLDIRTDFRISGSYLEPCMGKHVLIPSPEDLAQFKLMWSQCRPSTYQYWNDDPDVMHIEYLPTPELEREIDAWLKISLEPSPFGETYPKPIFLQEQRMK